MACISDRLYEARKNMQLIKQRDIVKPSKTYWTRLLLAEEHILFIADALAALLEAKEKGL